MRDWVCAAEEKQAYGGDGVLALMTGDCRACDGVGSVLSR